MPIEDRYLSTQNAHSFLGQQIAQPRTFSDETAARVDQAVMHLLHEAEKQAIRLIEELRDQVVQLVAKLEAEEALDLDAIKSCLVPGSTITPFVKNRKKRHEPHDSMRHK